MDITHKLHVGVCLSFWKDDKSSDELIILLLFFFAGQLLRNESNACNQGKTRASFLSMGHAKFGAVRFNALVNMLTQAGRSRVSPSAPLRVKDL